MARIDITAKTSSATQTLAKSVNNQDQEKRAKEQSRREDQVAQSKRTPEAVQTQKGQAINRLA